MTSEKDENVIRNKIGFFFSKKENDMKKRRLVALG